MTLYVIPTQSRLIRLPGEEKRIRGEFAVQHQLHAMGLTADAAVKITLKRQGKRRRPDPIEEPTLPGYVFADIPAEMFASAVRVQGSYGQAMAVPMGEVTGVRAFLRRVAVEREKVQRQIANGEVATTFDPGDVLEILSGPFKEQLAKFQGVIQRAYDSHPKLKLSMDLMGQQVPVEVDPLDVKKVG